MTKVGRAMIPVVLAGCATVLAANVFPDQVFGVLQNVVLRAGIAAQSAPASQGTPNAWNSATARFVLLPESEKSPVLRLCSRLGPKVEGTWKATQQDIAGLESNLSRISSLRSSGSLEGARIAHPEKCYRQYIPVVVAKKKLIYVNAFCGIEVPSWRTKFVTICDGGQSVWGVLYDPTTGEFSDLHVNGVA